MLSDKKAYLLIFAVVFSLLGAYFLDLKVLAEDDLGLAEGEIDIPVIEETTLLPAASPPDYSDVDVVRRFNVIVTAYSSSVGETDDTPLITASGSTVFQGIVANNMLPFGAQVRLPEIFGDRVFIVKDRMHWRKGNYHVDVWFPAKEEALAFGAKYATMEVLVD